MLSAAHTGQDTTKTHEFSWQGVGEINVQCRLSLVGLELRMNVSYMFPYGQEKELTILCGSALNRGTYARFD